jgi:ribonuclease P protein component
MRTKDHLKKIENFKFVFDNGLKVKTRTSQIFVHVAPNTQTESSPTCSFAVLALKKIVGKKAVSRNLARRRFKMAFWEEFKQHPFPSHLHVQIIAMTNKHALDAPWEALLSDVRLYFKRINELIHKAQP